MYASFYIFVFFGGILCEEKKLHKQGLWQSWGEIMWGDVLDRGYKFVFSGIIKERKRNKINENEKLFYVFAQWSRKKLI